MRTLDAIAKFPFSGILAYGTQAYRIEYDNEYGVFVPGKAVGGVLRLELREAVKANAVRISVHGKGSTNWSVFEDFSTDRRIRREAIPYEGEEVYLRAEAILWESSKDSEQLPAGVHSFPFTFDLPNNCPPSFEGTVGCVRYYCKARLVRPWKLDQTTRSVFTVIPTLDLNLIPSATLPVSIQQEVALGCCCFKHGIVRIKVTIAKNGYVPGESIVVSVEISNLSSRAMRRVELKLLENANYTAYRANSVVLLNAARHSDVDHKRHTRTVCQFTEDIFVPGGSNSIYRRMVPIPPTVPTFKNCSIIQVDYNLRVKVTAKAKIRNSITADVPVLIGTVPVKQFMQAIPEMISRWDGSKTALSTEDIRKEPPSSYKECVFGRGTIRDEEDNSGFAPKYVFYNMSEVGLT